VTTSIYTLPYSSSSSMECSEMCRLTFGTSSGDHIFTKGTCGKEEFRQDAVT